METRLKNRIAWLDLFRGFAAITIVVYHYRYYLGLRTFEFGLLAVDGFFVLSGIVLAMKYTDAIAEGMSFQAFSAARVKRLYPMMFPGRRADRVARHRGGPAQPLHVS